MLGVPVSRGYLSKLCTGVVSESLAEGYEEAKSAIPDQPQLGSDETSFKDNGKKNWVWCISSAIMTVFHIATSRSRKVLEELVGEEFKGYLNFDYYSANCSFAWNYDIKAQYCWAHLIRDMRFLLKHPNQKTRAWAEQQVRHIVIDRRITQGTRSESGQRFNERMWTAIATCKKQKKNFFEYLHASIEAKLSGAAAPSLIH